MQKSLTPKEALMSAAYAISLISILLILDYAFSLFFDFVLSHTLNWFNRLSLFWKIVLIVFGLTGIFSILLGLFEMVANLISRYVFSVFPFNNFTLYFSFVAAIINIGIMSYILWDLTKFTFWSFIEFLFLITLILAFNWAFVARQPKHSAN